MLIFNLRISINEVSGVSEDHEFNIGEFDDMTNMVIAPSAHPSVATWCSRLAAELCRQLGATTPLVVRVERPAVFALDAPRQLVARGAVAVGVDAEGRPALAIGPAALAGAALADTAGGDLAAALARFAAAGGEVARFPVEQCGAGAGEAMARLVLTSKARALGRLAPLGRGWSVDAPWIIGRAEWLSRREPIAEQALRRFRGPALIVRSSHASEDGWAQSKAGAFLSVVVPLTEGPAAGEPAAVTAAVAHAIDRVFAQYGTSHPGDEVFLQAHLRDVAASGVAMTRHPDTGAPYLVVSFDAVTGRTDVVTSGSGAFETAYVGRTADPAALPSPVREAHALAADLTGILGEDGLDIEFAVAGPTHLLQVRPVARAGWRGDLVEEDARTAALVEEAKRAHRALHAAAGAAVGAHPIYSSMTDWNPAEMIGRRPTALARSLYQHLITDRVWAEARAAAGYRDLRGVPLMHTFAGHVFIDVRASLSSFVPAAVPGEVAAALVDAQLAKLRAAPYLDDKIEFEVAETCARRGTRERLIGLGLSPAQAEPAAAALRQVTMTALDAVERDLASLEQPTARRVPVPPIRELGCALTAAVAGAGRFARLARCAFITTALLRDLIEAGALSSARADHLLRSVRSVTFEMRECGTQVAAGALPFKVLVRRYGHLRPGTYDIRVPRYDADPIRYLFPFAAAIANDEQEHAFEPTARELGELSRALASFGLPLSGPRFLALLSQAVRGREEGKLVFTRPLGDALELIAEWGEAHELSREQLAHLPLPAVLALRAAPERVARERGLALAHQGRAAFEATCRVELPEVLFSESDFDWHLAHRTRPSFVTTQTVRAAAVAIDKDYVPDLDQIAGRVVLIEHADPGFDWLFSTRIAGLVTAYGGANSHIGVRCAELNVPAAIGVGQETFRRVSRASELLLDCQGRRLVDVG